MRGGLCTQVLLHLAEKPVPAALFCDYLHFFAITGVVIASGGCAVDLLTSLLP